MEYTQNAMELSDRFSHIKRHRHLKSLTSSLLFGENVNIGVMEFVGEDDCIYVDCCLCSFKGKDEICQFLVVYH